MNRALVSFRPILTRSGSVIALPALYRGYSRGPAAEEPVLELRFYTKNVCPLCDTAMEELEKVAEKIPFDLEEIDIEHHENAVDFRKWRFDIPVLTWAQTDEVIAKHKFDATKVEAKLKAILERQKEKG